MNGATLTFDQTDENKITPSAVNRAPASTSRAPKQASLNPLVIGIYPSTGTIAPENCWNYTSTPTAQSVTSHLTSSLTSTQLSSDLGISGSLQAKYLLFSASDTFKYATKSQSSSTSFSSVWELGVTEKVSNALQTDATGSALSDPRLSTAAPQAFAQICGTALMTSYTASSKIYVTFTISNQSASQSQSIKNDFNANYGSFVSAMVSINGDSSINKAQTNVSVSFLAVGFSPAQTASISNALGGSNYAQCTAFQNPAASCAAFDADLNTAMGSIQTAISADLSSGKASYVDIDTSPLAIQTLSGTDLQIYGAPSGITNLFKPYESTLATDSSVVMDLLTLQALAQNYLNDANFGVLPEGMSTLGVLSTQYANAANLAVTTLDGCLDNVSGCKSLPTLSVNSTVGDPLALANAYLWALNFQISDPVQGFQNVQSFPLMTSTDVLFALPAGFSGGTGLAQATNASVTTTATAPQAPYLMQLTMSFPVSFQQAQPTTFTALTNFLVNDLQYGWPFVQPYLGSAQKESYFQGAPLNATYGYAGYLISGPACNPATFVCSGSYSSQTSSTWNAPGYFTLPLSISFQPNAILQTIGQANPLALNGQ